MPLETDVKQLQEDIRGAVEAGLVGAAEDLSSYAREEEKHWAEKSEALMPKGQAFKVRTQAHKLYPEQWGPSYRYKPP